MTTPGSGGLPSVTVVIPARDAASTIDAQLAAIATQDYPGPMEVIVADNGSVDDTVTRVEAWVDRIPQLRVVDAADRPGAAHARNAGVAAATSELVLLCDADDVADRAWARTLATALTTADAVAGGTAGFRGTVPLDGAPPPAFGRAGFDFLPALMSSSCGFRRTVWETIGGFDETLPTCEDIDFAWRLQLAGFTLVQEPNGFVHYRERPTPGAVLRQWYRYGHSQPVLRRRFGPAGLRSERPRQVVAGWGRLLLQSHRLLAGDEPRRRWCRDLGRRWGRLVGSLRARTVFL